MAFIPWPNGIQLCFDFTTASQLWQFCLGLRKQAGSVNEADLDAINTIASTWWTDHLKTFICSGTTLRQVRATNMTSQGAPQHILSVNDTGGDVNPPVVIGTAAVVSGRSEKRGRSYRGRTYLGGLATDEKLTATDMTAALAGSLVSIFGLLQTDLDTAGFDMVVPSKQHNGIPTNPAELNEIIAWVVDPHFDSQRRRLAGRGT